MGGIGILSPFLLGHRQIQARLVEAFAQLFVAAELLLDTILFLKERLRGLGIIPEARLGGFFEKFFFARG